MGGQKHKNEELNSKYCKFQEVLDKMKRQIKEEFNPEIIETQLEDSLNLSQEIYEQEAKLKSDQLKQLELNLEKQHSKHVNCSYGVCVFFLFVLWLNHNIHYNKRGNKQAQSNKTNRGQFHKQVWAFNTPKLAFKTPISAVLMLHLWHYKCQILSIMSGNMRV